MDAARNCVFAIKKGGAYDHNGAGGTYATIKRRRRSPLDGSALVNQWAAPAWGWGTIGICFINGSDVTRRATSGLGQRARSRCRGITRSFFLISPCGSTGALVQLWFSTLSAGQHVPDGRRSIYRPLLPASEVLHHPLDCGPVRTKVRRPFFLFAIPQTRVFDTVLRAARRFTPAIQLASGGYIDCGTSDTLKFDGAHHRFFRHPGHDRIRRAVGPTGANKQNPIICRTAGADNGGQYLSPWWPRCRKENGMARRLGRRVAAMGDPTADQNADHVRHVHGPLPANRAS